MQANHETYLNEFWLSFNRSDRIDRTRSYSARIGGSEPVHFERAGYRRQCARVVGVRRKTTNIIHVQLLVSNK